MTELANADVQHGLFSTYTNWGCRCAPCAAANSEKCRKYRQRTKAASTQDQEAQR